VKIIDKCKYLIILADKSSNYVKGGRVNIEKLIGSSVIMTIRFPEVQDKEIIPLIRSVRNGDTFSIIAEIVDYDNLGIWIEKNDYPIYNEDTRKMEKHKAHVLIRYDYITSIAAFPSLNENGLTKYHRIGFDQPEDKD
jgi:hypothetical protein